MKLIISQTSQLVKDLGVTSHPKLNINHHIYYITHKAIMILAILKQKKLFLDKTFPLLYKSMIIPHVEYANVVWYPKHKYQSIPVKRVQRRATKLLMGTRHMTYTQRLEYLDQPSLWYGILRGDMTKKFKTNYCKENMNCEKFYYI